MKRIVFGMALALGVVLGGVGEAKAAIVTFDDLPGDGVVPDGYGGINWGGTWDYYLDDQSPYSPHSPLTRVYTDYGTPYQQGTGENPFTFVTPNQVFQGAWFAGFDFAGPIHFNLYNDGILVATSADLFPSSTPTFLASGYSGPVDTVGVFATTHDYFVMDDVTYGAAAVPEPASMTMLGLGVASLAGYGLRKRKQAVAA